MSTPKSKTKSTPAKATRSSASKGTSKSKPAKKSAAAKEANYTKPELREKLKEKVKRGSKGGRPGQWSARKAQLLVHEYEEQGGGYKSSKRTESQQHLQQWTEEKWSTKSGKPAKDGEAMHRYLPKKAWDELTPAQKKATDRKKVAASRKGQQFVSNTEPAKSARRKASVATTKPGGKSSRNAVTKATTTAKKRAASPEAASTARTKASSSTSTRKKTSGRKASKSA